MSNLQIFDNPKFGEIRTIEENGAILICGVDVTRALGFKDTTNAMKQHCRGVVKRHLIDAMGRDQEMNFISVGDVYRLAARSRLDGAQEFESWIFDEVVPSVMKHGAYMTPETIEKAITNPDFIIKLASELKMEQEKNRLLNSKIDEDKPKVLFADAVTTAKTSILIGELAKLLKQNGVESMGQNRLFQWMRDNGYLIKRRGTDFNMPTQRSMEMGLFEIKETAVAHSDGHTVVNKTPKVTGKGQQYFINQFLRKTGGGETG